MMDEALRAPRSRTELRTPRVAHLRGCDQGRLSVNGILLVTLVGAFFVVCFPMPDVAATVPQEMNFTAEGKITKQSPGKLTLRTEGNMLFRVSYNEKTEIKRQDGSAGSAKDLRVGIRIRVEGELTEAGEVLAQKIEVTQEDSARQATDPSSLASCPCPLLRPDDKRIPPQQCPTTRFRST